MSLPRTRIGCILRPGSLLWADGFRATVLELRLPLETTALFFATSIPQGRFARSGISRRKEAAALYAIVHSFSIRQSRKNAANTKASALEAWQRDALLDFEGSLERCLAILFIQATERMTRVHMAKGFVKQDIAATQVRGCIRASAMAEQIWRLPRVPQTVRTRSFDIAANQVIAIALDRLKQLRLELPKEVRKQFAALNDSWSVVKRSSADLRELINLALSSPPAGYRTALTLARFILLGARLDPVAGSGGTIFTISLARIWEKALEELCREIQDETGWRVQSRRHCVRSWHDASVEGDANRQLIVDVLLRKGGNRKVFDAKYKCDYGQESRVDRFQMCAYALAFNAQNVVLVYPSDRGLPDPYRLLLRHETPDSSFTIGSMFLSMRQGPATCRTQLQSAFETELS